MPEWSAEEQAEYVHEVVEFRGQKDDFFRASPQSPIPPGQRGKRFPGLSYYPPSLEYRIEARVVPFTQQDVIQMGTTTGDIRPMLRYAELRFRNGDRDLRLVGYLDPHYREHHHGHDHGVELFIPFRDATSGKETYGAGRYMEAQVEEAEDGGEVATLDFNLAYSPYCVYNEAYSCPLPPAENTLAVAIPAGEKTYEAGH